MLDSAFHLSGTLAVLTEVVCFSFRPVDPGYTLRTEAGHLEMNCSPRSLLPYRSAYLWNDIAPLFHDNGIARAEIKLLNVVNIVQSCAANSATGVMVPILPT
ncbi:MAG: hypothetical protein HW407_398 [Bacteroidetes bacterium]|nr:hypothetical protein [Bacteroidota bacterium]